MTIVGSPLESCLPYPDLSVIELFDRSVERWGDRIALVDGVSGAEYSYSTVGEVVSLVGRALQDDGIGPGDCVAIVAGNSPEWIVTFMAAQAAGAAVTTLNPLYTSREVRYQLEDSGASAVFAGSATAEAVLEAWEGNEHFYVTTDVWEMAERSAGNVAGVAVDPRTDVAALPYSSGTTGLPKGVMLSHHNLVANVHQLLAPGPVDDTSVMIDFLPFFHIYGMVGLMTIGFVAGAKQVVMPGFDRELFARLVTEQQATNLFVVPPVMLELAQGLEGDWSSVRHIQTAAAPVPAHVIETVEQVCGAEVYEGYGLTEASPATHSTRTGPIRRGTVGRLLPDTRQRVVDMETGADLGPGELGELLVSGPQVMLGYLGSPEATAAAIVEDESGRWLRTGDIVTVDDEGYVTLRDRAKEMIKYRGYAVAPAELESVLLEHRDIVDAAVVSQSVGGGDGEIPRAYVVLAEGAEMTDEQVKEHVRARVAPFKRIREVEFIDSVPKSPTGKTLRRELKDRAAVEARSDEEA
ncbi:MAG: 4-coumarate--CoA ligase family protein [Actinomycetia bacterium]|nr:4-coumarate--CoA ligase family protein [Actinomycetes bacterium]